MEPMFADRSRKPTPSALTKALGRTRRHWDAILDHVDRTCDGVTQEWKFYGPSYGWTYKLSRKRRALLYLAPRRSRFLASMALKGQALEGLRTSRLPPDVVAEIERAEAWPEGKPARVEVTNLKHVATVEKLIDLKAGA